MTGDRPRRVLLDGVRAAGAVAVASALLATTPRLPDRLSVTAIDRWWTDVGTPAAAMTIVQLIAVGLASWVALAVAVDVAARIHPTRALLATRRILHRPALSRLLGGAMLLTAAGPAATAGAGDPTPADDTPVDDPAPEEPPADDVLLVDLGPADAKPPGDGDRVLLIDIGSAPETPSTNIGEPPPEVPMSTPVTADDDTWTVRRGDHLWHIARETVVDRGGDATDADVAAYWTRLIEANHDVVGDEPDLIHPGQVVRLPE